MVFAAMFNIVGNATSGNIDSPGVINNFLQLVTGNPNF